MMKNSSLAQNAYGVMVLSCYYSLVLWQAPR